MYFGFLNCSSSGGGRRPLWRTSALQRSSGLVARRARRLGRGKKNGRKALVYLVTCSGLREARNRSVEMTVGVGVVLGFAGA